MKREFNVGLYQFVFSVSQALDLINPVMSDRHKRVAYIAMRVAEAVGMTGRNKEDIVVAAALHDIGGLSIRKTDGERSYEMNTRSARFGYQLLQKFRPFRIPARIVRFHHVPWAHGDNREVEGIEVPLGSHVVHLAKRVHDLIDKHSPILSQVSRIRSEIQSMRGDALMPDHVDAFTDLALREAFWLDIHSPELMRIMADRIPFSTVELDLDGLLDFAELLAQIIDFRSRFTATHSSGVAASAATLAQLFGLPEVDCKRLSIAGYLHDIGKLAIPIDLLEKNGRLTEEEWHLVRGHPYYTYRILAPIKGLEDIALWSGAHHERLCGTGYPFRIHQADLPLEARILALADIFTALTENRPYRTGMREAEVIEILGMMVDNHELDSRIFKVLREHYGEVDRSRAAAQAEALAEYSGFMEGLAVLDLSAAKAAHLAWKHRLRAFLDGGNALTLEQAVSHHECELGRWYYGEGLHHYGHIPEMRALEEPHAALHQLIRAVLNHHERGRLVEAEACLARVEPLSEQIVSLLGRIEHKAAKLISESIGADL